jgi:simple sugar transport system ATP-binding protein
VRAFARSGQCTVIIITHKFREVMAYADAVTVLRRGRAVHHCRVDQTTPALLAQAMMGEAAVATAPAPDQGTNLSVQDVLEKTHGQKAELDQAEQAQGATDNVATSAMAALLVDNLSALGDRGTLALHGVQLQVQRGEILGVAGVSGNGQRELVEALVGQRPRLSGRVSVMGETYSATRAENRRLKVRSLPEEPLRNACVGNLSVAENMALRDFDQAPLLQGGLLRFSVWRSRARAWISEYGIKTQGERAPIGSLSGGNVQRAVLARELAGEINVLIAANPVFGLDFAAVSEIHTRLRQVRADGAGVLLISEDLDELLELSDRIVVMSEGRVVFETTAAEADRQVLGTHMGGGAHAADANDEKVAA